MTTKEARLLLRLKFKELTSNDKPIHYWITPCSIDEFCQKISIESLKSLLYKETFSRSNISWKHYTFPIRTDKDLQSKLNDYFLTSQEQLNKLNNWED